jgi:hypothetical protein
LTGFFFLSLGMLITSFFDKAKPGVLFAIISFFILYGVQISMDSFEAQSLKRNTYFALSPVAGLKKAGSIVMLAQSNDQAFGFDNFGETVLDFGYSRWFWITLIESVLFVLLGIYFDQVWPKDTGVRKHPLFCFMKKGKGKIGKVVILV